MAAILQSANILANNAAQYQNANARIFDAITNAANAYEERQRLRVAALDKERERMAIQQDKQQEMMLDPEKVTMAVLQKAQLDPASVTPAEKAAFEAAQKTLGAKMALDPLGRAYNAYQPIPLGAPRPADLMVPVVREEPLASPVVAMPTAANLMTAPAGTLLPPPAAGQQGDMELFNKPAEAPAPIGQAEVKRSAVSQVAPPKMIQGAGGPVPDPVDMERYKAELAAAKEADVGGAKTEADKRTAKFNDTKAFSGLLGDITNLNSKIDTAIKQSSRLNTGAMAGQEGRGRFGSGYLTGGIDLSETLKTIESDSALGKLSEMKQQSSTGASGLGAASEREIGLLMAARQSVAQSQTEGQLDANLKEYKKIRTQVLKNMAEAYKEQYGEYPKGYSPEKFGGEAQPEKPKMGQIIDGYRYNGGDPASPQSYTKVR